MPHLCILFAMLMLCVDGFALKKEIKKQEPPREYVLFITEVNQRVETIERNIKYLTDKQADVRNPQNRLDKVRRLLRPFTDEVPSEHRGASKTVLDMEIAGLDAEVKSKIFFIQQLDILSIAMVIFLLVVITGIFIYTLVMYGKRKK